MSDEIVSVAATANHAQELSDHSSDTVMVDTDLANLDVYSELTTEGSSRVSTVEVQCIQFLFSKTLFDFKKSISGLIELKFSGKTPNEVLYAPIYFWGVYF